MTKNNIIGLVIIVGLLIGYSLWMTPSKEEMAAHIANVLGRGDVLLVKGSRGMKMEELISAVRGAKGL